MTFPCIVCQNIYNGDFLWNLHGNSISEDRHLLCSSCLIKFSKKNATCPLKCGNPYMPVQLNPGYKELLTNVNLDFALKHPTHLNVPDAQDLENQQLWMEIINNVDKYIIQDNYPIVYGCGKFRELTFYMNSLKSHSIENNLKAVISLHDHTFGEDIEIKVGCKRQIREDDNRLHEFNLGEIFALETT